MPPVDRYAQSGHRCGPRMDVIASLHITVNFLAVASHQHMGHLSLILQGIHSGGFGRTSELVPTLLPPPPCLFAHSLGCSHWCHTYRNIHPQYPENLGNIVCGVTAILLKITAYNC